MKYIKYLLVVLLSSFIYLGNASASTDFYYINAKIEENGDMTVTEVKNLNGNYNGFYTTLGYKSDFTNFDVGDDYFLDLDKYNATDLTDLQVYSLSPSGKDFYSLVNAEPANLFYEVNYASSGEYGKYVRKDTVGRVKLQIFQPSVRNLASAVRYTLKDVVVVHDDVAEIAWDFISKSYEEDIENLEIHVQLPGTSKLLRVFSHGPYTGVNSIVSQSEVKLVDTDVLAYHAIDMRVVFDKDLVPGARKQSSIEGMEGILAYEKIQAERANSDRQAAVKQIRFVNISSYLFIGISLLIAVVFYFKYDREYKSSFTSKYNREFIEDYNVEVIDYLMKKSITSNAMSASIMNLIYKKLIKAEKLTETKGGETYQFTLINYSENQAENELQTFLFNDVGDGKQFTDKELHEYAKGYKTYNIFQSRFSEWKKTVTSEGIKQQFWESSLGKSGLYSLFLFLGSAFISFYSNNAYGYWTTLNIIVIAVALVCFIYSITSKKRTKNGCEHHAKWKAFKNFLDDFGTFENKDLPEVVLWERYLVYATIFGLADKIEKIMNVKIQEMYDNRSCDPSMLTRMIYYNNINRIVHTSVTNSVIAANQAAARVAASAASSAGGFGGGSSFGGGGFGGGGSGGGRF